MENYGDGHQIFCLGGCLPGGLPCTKEEGNCEFARGGNDADASWVIMGRGCPVVGHSCMFFKKLG